MESFESLREKFEEKTVATQRLHEGRIINLREDTVTLPSGRTGKREIVEHKGAVAILPIREDGKLVLIRQFRKPVEGILVEIPAGGLNPGEDPADCAARELVEECGLKARNWSLMFSCFLAPGYSTELIHIYLAQDLIQVEAEPEEDENIEIGEYTLEEALQLIDDGKVQDAKTLAGILGYYRQVHSSPQAG